MNLITPASPTLFFARRAELANTRWFGPHLFSFLARSDDTDGQFALLEARLLAGGEPPSHTHRQDDEVFYILEGEIRFRIGMRTARAGEGDCILLPAGLEHGFQIISGQAHALLLSAPAGLENAFLALSDPAGRLELRYDPPPLDPERFLAEFAQCGLSFRAPNTTELITRPDPTLIARPMMGRSRWHRGRLLTSLVTGSQSDGRFALIEILTRRGLEPPLRTHAITTESYYVLDGEVRFTCAGQTRTARGGDLVVLPRGRPNSLSIQTNTARMLLLLTPAKLEEEFLEGSVPAPALTLPPVGQ